MTRGGEGDRKKDYIRRRGENICAPRLPYFAVPLYIEFRAGLPRTPTGKVQKDLLRQEGRTPRTWSRDDAGFVLEKR